MLQYSLFGIKPDVFYDKSIPREDGSGLKIPLPKPEDFIAEIIGELQKVGLEIKSERKYLVSREIALKHYSEHEFVYDIKSRISKQEFLARYMVSDYSYWIVFYGENTIKLGREVLKNIREKYLLTPWFARYSLMHASDNPVGAIEEIKLHFPEFSF
ncbi:MAG: nucleoside-diphosphate kinase [Candidatus Gracilibacteria bacterium]|nr:nucleoside-diphosphate kinase [Candidatus Gracilibacteria bacterium]